MKNTIENPQENIDPEAGKKKADSEIRLKRGTILVSSPMLTDPNFKRSAILILDTDSQGGYIGLIINRKLEITLEEVCQLPGINGKMKIRSGGPVDLQRIFWLHNFGERLKGALEILPGLFVGGDYDEMISLFMNSKKNLSDDIHLYLGYSGWSKGQLEKEVEMGAWGIVNDLLDPQLLLEAEGDELWNRLCLRLGPDYRHWRIIPSDPSLN